ncbi:transposase [Acetobacter malorum]
MRKDAEQRHHALRELFNGLRYMIRHGIAERAMPNGPLPCSAVYQHPHRWRAAGYFDARVSDLLIVLRIAYGRKAEPTQPFSAARHYVLRWKAVPAPDMIGGNARGDQSCIWRWTRCGNCWPCT